MPAVVRVKRRIDEEPLSAFILNGKRRRLEDSSDANKEELSTLLKFAGTIKEQDDSATTQFARLTKEEAKELVLQKTRKPINVTEKSRQDTRQNAHEQRFRVVNCMRTTLQDETAADDDDGQKLLNTMTKSKEITIVDIEKHSLENDKTAAAINSTTTLTNDRQEEKATTSLAAQTHLDSFSSAAAARSSTLSQVQATTDSDMGYVYDLYIPDCDQQADYVDLMDDNYLSIRAFDDFMYDERYDDEEYDSEDSNQENYFGNEYPDEDDDMALNSDRENDNDDADDNDETLGARDLRQGLERFVLGEDDDDENDLNIYDNDTSSDDDGDNERYRDPYIHTVDPEEEGFCEDVDACDVNRYGMAYARYKARVLKTLKPTAGDDDDDDDDEDSLEDFGSESDDERYHSANESDEEYFD